MGLASWSGANISREATWAAASAVARTRKEERSWKRQVGLAGHPGHRGVSLRAVRWLIRATLAALARARTDKSSSMSGSRTAHFGSAEDLQNCRSHKMLPCGSI